MDFFWGRFPSFVLKVCSVVGTEERLHQRVRGAARGAPADDLRRPKFQKLYFRRPIAIHTQSGTDTYLF